MENLEENIPAIENLSTRNLTITEDDGKKIKNESDNLAEEVDPESLLLGNNVDEEIHSNQTDDETENFFVDDVPEHDQNFYWFDNEEGNEDTEKFFSHEITDSDESEPINFFVHEKSGNGSSELSDSSAENLFGTEEYHSDDDPDKYFINEEVEKDISENFNEQISEEEAENLIIDAEFERKSDSEDQIDDLDLKNSKKTSKEGGSSQTSDGIFDIEKRMTLLRARNEFISKSPIKSTSSPRNIVNSYKRRAMIKHIPALKVLKVSHDESEIIEESSSGSIDSREPENDLSNLKEKQQSNTNIFLDNKLEKCGTTLKKIKVPTNQDLKNSFEVSSTIPTSSSFPTLIPSSEKASNFPIHLSMHSKYHPTIYAHLSVQKSVNSNQNKLQSSTQQITRTTPALSQSSASSIQIKSQASDQPQSLVSSTSSQPKTRHSASAPPRPQTSSSSSSAQPRPQTPTSSSLLHSRPQASVSAQSKPQPSTSAHSLPPSQLSSLTHPRPQAWVVSAKYQPSKFEQALASSQLSSLSQSKPQSWVSAQFKIHHSASEQSPTSFKLSNAVQARHKTSTSVPSSSLSKCQSTSNSDSEKIKSKNNELQTNRSVHLSVVQEKPIKTTNFPKKISPLVVRTQNSHHGKYDFINERIVDPKTQQDSSTTPELCQSHHNNDLRPPQTNPFIVRSKPSPMQLSSSDSPTLHDRFEIPIPKIITPPFKYTIPQDLLASDDDKVMTKEQITLNNRKADSSENSCSTPDLFVFDNEHQQEEEEDEAVKKVQNVRNRRKSALVPKKDDGDIEFEEPSMELPIRPKGNIELIDNLAKYRALVHNLLMKLNMPSIDFNGLSDDYINLYKIYRH
ncbi:CLUMA_CG014111, isoform A [Clunio marinus]|uniref:CLUMA_CG014111, isoform A n=1 Tax=Clunio marinus TaxID=568069 RepID=A0A1J1IMT7_9DIPT|nr:CLUMA_CG014111, isoform A [Clunio marinus]